MKAGKPKKDNELPIAKEGKVSEVPKTDYPIGTRLSCGGIVSGYHFEKGQWMVEVMYND